jgi:hypothetical protein
MWQTPFGPSNAVGKGTREETYYNGTSWRVRAMFIPPQLFKTVIHQNQSKKELPWRFNVAGNNKTIRLPDFNQIWVSRHFFQQILQHQISRKSA